ncbi:GGDEF domain-containing protein [Hydrogenimonas sp. SS33]|uniref:GGDEF domain-containing protein n=1 Tax=Hydrogenimonas leucolamina TaxID=2954236 RepID=UPI00336BEBB5
MKITRQFDLVLKTAITVLAVLTTVMFYLYLQVDKTLVSTRQEMTDMLIERYVMELENAVDLIKEETGGALLAELAENRSLREHLEKDLNHFRTKELEDVFAVFRDSHGHYRYLLDTEPDPEEKAIFRQRFEPVSDVWDRVYATKKRQIHRHVEKGSLWVTAAIPIVENGTVSAVLGSDLSAHIRSDVDRHFTQIKSIMLGVAFVILVLLIFGYLQIYYYFKGRSRSFVDPLTGSCNRKFFYEILAPGEYRNFHIIMYDVDNFKQVNDTCGHETGDDVLRMLSARVRKLLRQEDYLVRFGGEEFVAFVKSRGEKETVEIAERIRKAIESTPFIIGEKSLSVTISLGINTDVGESPDAEDAVEKADRELYRAKKAGRNRICIRGRVVS